MIRVVADTNVLISALIFGGLPNHFLDLALRGSFLLVTSPELLDELDDKLRTKFGYPEFDATIVRRKLETWALVVNPDIVLDVVTNDPDDNRVLECAVSGNAEYVVSGDRHLLKMGSYAGISILTVRQFMDGIEAGRRAP